MYGCKFLFFLHVYLNYSLKKFLFILNFLYVNLDITVNIIQKKKNPKLFIIIVPKKIV
jgi:hypothetical protein